MPGFIIPADGLKLSALPASGGGFKKDRIPQAVEFELPASFTLGRIQELDGRVQARLAAPSPRFEIDGKKTSLDLCLHEGGYLYRHEDGASTFSLKSRLDLRVPEKAAAGADSGLSKLVAGLTSLNAEKRSAATAEISLSDTVRDGKRRKIDVGAHRRGLFGAQAGSRSATGSPNGAPLNVPTIKVVSDDPLKAARQEAIRTALIHLVAIRDVSKDYIVRALRCSTSDVDPILSRHCTNGLDPKKYKLNQKAFRLLQPYTFGYKDDDRKVVINKTIEIFDRMRLGPEEKEWQMLLPKEDRGKGICLSKLEKRKEAVQEEKAAAREAKSLAEIAQPSNSEKQVSDSHPPSHAGSRPGSAGSISIKPQPSVKKVPTSSAKETKSQHQRTTSRNEIHLQANSASPQTLPASAKAKTMAKKPAAKKAAAAPAPPSSKIKSAEFITESDDEEAEAATKVNGVSPRPVPVKDVAVGKEARRPDASTTKTGDAVTAKKHASTEKSARPSTGAPISNKSMSVAAPKPVTPAAAVSPLKTASKPAPKPAPLDKSKFSAKPTIASNTSRPATPTSATARPTIVKKPLVVKKITKPAGTESALSHAVPSRSVPTTTSKANSNESAKLVVKATEKTTSQTSGSRDSSQKPVPKRDPNVPPKKYVPEQSSAPAKRVSTGELKTKTATGTTTAKSVASSAKSEATGKAPSAQTKPTAASTTAKSADSVKAPAMRKTFSHQRKSSSPIKPSPLASSPPISASDMDEARGSTKISSATTPLKRPATTAAQRPIIKVARREAPASQANPRSGVDADRVVKRKASELDRSSSAQVKEVASSLERPAKRRESGAPAPRSTGAAGSNASRPSTDNLKAKADNAERADSHSPSPASSTIGSTSTKGTTMSMISSAGSRESAKGKQLMKQDEKNSERVKGFGRTDLERALEFEQARDEYNRLQREVARMDNPPVERIRELHRRFTKLETQKRTLTLVADMN